jgi:hypothetical protein
MADPMTGPITRCPWCSAALQSDDPERCPACGAQLVVHPSVEGEIKGVTALDTDAILRARSELNRPRGRLLSMITGEASVDTTTPADPDVFAPPPDAVRREMLRLQFEAERADLTAESIALKADELARRGIHLRDLGGLEPAANPGPEAQADGGAAPEAAPETPVPDLSAVAAPEVPWATDEEPPAGG